MYCPGIHAGDQFKIIVLALAECVSVRGLRLKPGEFLFIHFPVMNAGQYMRQFRMHLFTNGHRKNCTFFLCGTSGSYISIWLRMLLIALLLRIKNCRSARYQTKLR